MKALACRSPAAKGRLRQVLPHASGFVQRNQGGRPSRVLFRGAAWLLGFTSFCKLITVAGANHLLSLPDPVLGVPTRAVLTLAGALELATVGLLIWRGLSGFWKAISLVWLGGCFMIYKTLLWAVDPAHPCGCLGYLGKWLLLSEESLGRLTTGLAVLLLCGGLLTAAMEWPLRKTRSNEISNSENR